MRWLLLLWLVLQVPLSGLGQGYFDYIFFGGNFGPGHGLRWNHSTRLFDSIPYPLTATGGTMQHLTGVNDCYGQMLYYIGDGGRLYNHLLDTVVNYRLDSIGDFQHMPIKVPNSNGKFLLFKKSAIGNNLEVVAIEPLFNNRQGRILAPPQIIARNVPNGRMAFRIAASPRENELIIFCVQGYGIGMIDIFAYAYNTSSGVIQVQDSLRRVLGPQMMSPALEINSSGTKLVFQRRNFIGANMVNTVVADFDTSTMRFTNTVNFTFNRIPNSPLQIWHFKNDVELFGIWQRSSNTISLHR
jgi:hypothetical protein